MKYLKMLVLSLISISSLSLLCAHDPVEKFAAILHGGAQNCHETQFTPDFTASHFTVSFNNALAPLTQKQVIQAFQYRVNGQNAISRARSIGGEDCLKYAEQIEEMKKYFDAVGSVPEAADLTAEEIRTKRMFEPEFDAAIEKAIKSVK